VDKRNFHLFQPLLYQVATGGLSPGDIAYPLRSALGKTPNMTILAAEVVDFLPDERKVLLVDGQLQYDSLIVATGVENFYFGNDIWSETAPALKSIDRRSWLNFVVVGGGATGVELSGAISMLANTTLKGEFRHFDPQDAEVILLEGSERLLNSFPEGLSAKALDELRGLGVKVKTSHLVTDIQEEHIKVRDVLRDEEMEIQTRTVLWAAGVRASPLGQKLAEKVGAEVDRMGRVVVEEDLTLAQYPEIFVIGDLAHFAHQTGEPMPGIAQVAMQGGSYAGNLIQKRLAGETLLPFRYKDKGTMAVIGRNAAVAEIGPFQFGGIIAWLVWLFIHIGFLIGFDNKVGVLIQWAWHYVTRKKGALLITGPEPYPIIQGSDPNGDEGEE
jgi:NADH dehydrogenase